jgi:hypothetical protein
VLLCVSTADLVLVDGMGPRVERVVVQVPYPTEILFVMLDLVPVVRVRASHALEALNGRKKLAGTGLVNHPKPVVRVRKNELPSTRAARH